jgi:hypothetical protein
VDVDELEIHMILPSKAYGECAFFSDDIAENSDDQLLGNRL